jgi:hypothetical protein
MGIALLQDGQRTRALDQLDRAGQLNISDDGGQSIRDKANLVLGTLYMEDAAFGDAQARFDRVSLEGPLSNQALLQSGWAAVSDQSFDRAIVPWSILAEREDTDAAVQEARLALPYAYGELEVHGRAALLYGAALESFDTEARKLDASINSIRQGQFLQALVREEIRQDEDWVIRLRQLPESPETYYLMELLASHDFQTALQNYLDLDDMRVRLVSWRRSFDAYEDLIELRRQNYEPLLPEIDQEFRELDSRIRLRRQQYDLLQRRMHDLLTVPRPEFLATTDERLMADQIAEIERAFASDESLQGPMFRARARRLRGALMFRLETEYHDRLTEFDTNLRALQNDIDEMTEQYDAFVRTRQAAVHSFEGYTVPTRRLRTRVNDALSSVELLMARQGHVLERVAVDELIVRLDSVNHYRDQARFAMADSYDRATKARELESGTATTTGTEQAGVRENAR